MFSTIKSDPSYLLQGGEIIKFIPRTVKIVFCSLAASCLLKSEMVLITHHCPLISGPCIVVVMHQRQSVST